LFSTIKIIKHITITEDNNKNHWILNLTSFSFSVEGILQICLLRT